ncbi:MAG TPA: DUF4118 domain-containing protein [Gemmatimonadales bacterium]
MPRARHRDSSGSRGGGYTRAVAIVALATLLCFLLRPELKTIDVAMIFLLAVVTVASRSHQGPALVATLLAIAAFDFIFVPPYYTFDVHDTAYFLTFVVMLVVALVMSRLTARILEQAEAATERERRTAALYAMERELADVAGRDAVVAIAARHIRQAAGGGSAVLLADELESGQGGPRWPPDGVFDNLEVRVATTWAYEHLQAAGMATANCREAEALAVPLRSTGRALGVAVAWPAGTERAISDAERDTVVALADQAAGALERAILAERTQKARVEVEAERLRTSLLSSLSRDLRTPLSGIEGAASSLLQDADSLSREVRAELAGSILAESRRMTRLVTNLLDMIRVESGALAVRKSWQPLEETLGVALLRLDERLRGHPVDVRLPDDLPLVAIDELLIEEVFINLLENAAKYTPPGTPVTIRAWTEGAAVVVEVADRGPGVPPGEEESVFGRFHRISSGDAAGAGAGSGLGLTICRGIIAAHGGRIWLERRAEGGVAVRFTLPLEGPPPDVLPPEPAES